MNRIEGFYLLGGKIVGFLLLIWFGLAIMMEQGKYRKMMSALRNQWEEIGYQNQSAYLWKSLQSLNADLLIGSIQITQQKRQISVIQDKIDFINEQQKQSQSSQQNEDEEESQLPQNATPTFIKLGNYYICQLCKNPPKFRRQSNIRLHTTLLHTQQFLSLPTRFTYCIDIDLSPL